METNWIVIDENNALISVHESEPIVTPPEVSIEHTFKLPHRQNPLFWKWNGTDLVPQEDDIIEELIEEKTGESDPLGIAILNEDPVDLSKKLVWYNKTEELVKASVNGQKTLLSRVQVMARGVTPIDINDKKTPTLVLMNSIDGQNSWNFSLSGGRIKLNLTGWYHASYKVSGLTDKKNSEPACILKLNDDTLEDSFISNWMQKNSNGSMANSGFLFYGNVNDLLGLYGYSTGGSGEYEIDNNIITLEYLGL